MGDALLATITIDVDPTIDIGPLTLAWHGLATAVGLLAGSAVAVSYAKRRGLEKDPLLSLLLVLTAALTLGRGASSAVRRRFRDLASLSPAGAVLLAAAIIGAGCGDTDDEKQVADDPVIEDVVREDPGPIHVHGLGIDPADGALFIATHTGLFRAAENERKAQRVAGRYQDTMAFTVLGPNRFMGSGHPDGREKLPPFLGLIESRDAGRSWKPISLQGMVDFHVLEVAGRRRVYGFGSDYETRRSRFLASTDGGKRWHDREIPGPFASVAVHPGNARRLVAAGEKGLHGSGDAGANWRTLRGTPGLLAWPKADRLYVVDADGAVSVSRDAGRGWRAVGEIGGAAAAFEPGARGRLLAALHDGTIKQSKDGGRTWTVRSAP